VGVVCEKIVASLAVQHVGSTERATCLAPLLRADMRRFFFVCVVLMPRFLSHVSRALIRLRRYRCRRFCPFLPVCPCVCVSLCVRAGQPVCLCVDGQVAQGVRRHRRRAGAHPP